uniref:PlsC domain-containing protein n=2 Tax=Caenorhabditis tropicalis TaxID=1561998 RepID=A0A1I7U0Z4_9PELO
MFLAFSMLFLAISSGICVTMDAEKKHFRYCGITFAKLFNMSTGLLVNFHDKRNRPRFPGVAVANHLSANDVMTIYSGCDYDGVGYTITGQSHGGIVKYFYKYGGKLTPLLLVNRECDKNRNALLQAIVEHSKSKDEDAYPVLLFPEGYCSNNKSVLQFRKAIFDGQSAIYPIAMKQDSRFGDVFWYEHTFLPYLIRIMTSWCTLIDIYYLPPMYKEKTETEEQFAKRVQNAIAAKISVDALPYDGKLKSEKERLKYKEKLQTCLADKLLI